MSYQKTTGFFLSANGIDQVAYYVYTPGEKPWAVLQLSHGMCEYIERYEQVPFLEEMTRAGVLVCGNDHLGHGKTAPKQEDLGYFDQKDGWRTLPKDLHQLTAKIRSLYPGLPIFLLGHSMGSFAARAYLSQYGQELAGALLVGTSGGEPLAGVGMALAKFIGLFKGDRHRSRLINGMAFGFYNRKYEQHRSSFDWLSRDPQIVDRYVEDPYCHFLFTLNGFYNLFHLLKTVSKKGWAQSVPKDLPILLLSGDMDPVGQFGKGVEKVCRRLREAGVKQVDCKLYEGGRHEIINEINRSDVYEDILRFLITTAKGEKA